jgi:two-component system phosphate regulon sensor histidine kinase PhoR
MTLRGRTVSLLLGMALLTLAVNTLFLAYVIQHQRVVIEETLREKEAQAIHLLAKQTEESVDKALRDALISQIPQDITDLYDPRKWKTFGSTDLVSRMGVINVEDGAFNIVSQEVNEHDREFDLWLRERMALELGAVKISDHLMHTFSEFVEGRRLLFVWRFVHAGTNPKNDIVIVTQVNLDALFDQAMQPLFAEFSQKHNGTLALHDPEAPWDDDAINSPIGSIIPGWMLTYKPNPAEEELQLESERQIVITVGVSFLITILITIFAVWREIRSELQFAELRNKFVANVSHELRTPLALIRLYAETLYLGRLTDPEKSRQYLQTILHQSERLTNMIDKVLEFSKRTHQKNQFSPDADDITQTVAAVLAGYVEIAKEKHIGVEADLPNDILPIKHEKEAISSLVTNLLDNAVKYAADNGKVMVRLKNTDSGVELSVIDNGQGIAPADRERLLKPFERGQNASRIGGWGLGLALVEEIARLHHATLSIDENVNKSGTHVRVLFTGEKGKKT